MPKDSSAVLAQVGQALSVFAEFLGAAPRAAEAESAGAGEEGGEGA